MNDYKLYTGDNRFMRCSYLLENQSYLKFRENLDKIYGEFHNWAFMDFRKYLVIANHELEKYNAKFVFGVGTDLEYICFASAEDHFEFILEWS